MEFVRRHLSFEGQFAPHCLRQIVLDLGRGDVGCHPVYQTIHSLGIGLEGSLHDRLAAMYRSRPAAEGSIRPITAPLQDIVKHGGIVAEWVFPHHDRADAALDQGAEPIPWTPQIFGQDRRQGLTLRKIEEPLWGLNPSDVWIAEIPKGMLENGWKRTRIGVADDQKVARSPLHGITQVASLEADVALAGDIVDPFLLGHPPHLLSFAIVEDIDLDIYRVGIGDFLGILDAQTYEFGVFIIGGKVHVDAN